MRFASKGGSVLRIDDPIPARAKDYPPVPTKRDKTEPYEERDRTPTDPIRDPILATGMGSRLAQIADVIGDRKAAAEAAGVSVASLQRYLAEEVEPPFSAVARLALAARASIDWVATGHGQMQSDVASFSDAEFTFIPRLAVEVSAGHGLDVENEAVLDRLAFKRSWIEGQIAVNPSNLVIVTARGDSMLPTFNDGDVLLVDTSRTDRREDGIYVIRTDHGVIAKRLCFGFDGGVTVISDNPSYPPREYDADHAEHLVVAGRVVWAGRKL